MDAGPGTDLGTLGWFLGVWVVMMAAMMFPSVAPTVALYSTMTRRRGRLRRCCFTAGYLFVWAAVGLVAYALFALAGRPRRRAGLGRRRAVGGRRHASSPRLYELTPLKDACLARAAARSASCSAAARRARGAVDGRQARRAGASAAAGR